MSTIDIAYLALILFAFVGFAGVLAYYNHTCAEPQRKERDTVAGRPHLALSH